MPLAGKLYSGYLPQLGTLKIPSQIGRYLFCESLGEAVGPVSPSTFRYMFRSDARNSNQFRAGF